MDLKIIDIERIFSFLITEFDFKETKSEESNIYKAKYLVIYKNVNANLQLEICADDFWAHCQIRRIINGLPAKHNDIKNCFGFEDLALLENENYEHMDYFAGSSNGTKVLHKIADLFKRNKVFFTTDVWIDTKKVKQLKRAALERTFGFTSRDENNYKSYFRELKRQTITLLKEDGYELVIDSDELPQYDDRKSVENFIMKKGSKTITVTQQDWRDNYFLYNIIIDGKTIFELDTGDHRDVDNAVNYTLEFLRPHI